MPRLLLVGFSDFGEMNSSGSVRLHRMYDAFVKLGYDVSLLSGLQDRRKRVHQKIREIRREPPKLCYIEPPDRSVFSPCDYFLLLYLRLKKIPVGLFYHDVCWKLSDMWPVKGIKNPLLKILHIFDLFIIKHTCKVVFFPTESMAKLFNLKRQCVLPPAGADFVTPEHETARRALYIGGVSKLCGTDIMLKAFEIINGPMRENIKLTVCCRETEMKGFFERYLGAPWLEIIHLSGDEQLRPYYERSDVALCPSRNNSYNDLCLPLTMFEYLSRALPVVTVDCREAARFVLQNGIGVVSQCKPEAFAAAVTSLVGDRRQLHLCRVRAKSALRRRNLWEYRAQKAAHEILN